MTDDLYKNGLFWDTTLYLRVGRAFALVDVDEAGRATREPALRDFVSLGGDGDPMWTRMPETLEERRHGVKPAYIGTLTPTHRVNLYRFLLRRARHIENAVSFFWLANPLGPRGDNATDAFLEMSDWTWEHPEEWLASTPFMLALGALILGDGNRAVLEEAVA